MASVTDFVMVRFATRKYSFVRIAHANIVPWLEMKRISFTVIGAKTYFELPEELERYATVSDSVREEMRPVATEITRRLSAISWSTMNKFRDPLSYDELQNLADIGVAIHL